MNENHIHNQFCSYEISLKLKQLGFDEACLGIYRHGELRTDTKIEYLASQEKVQYMFGKNTILAILYQQSFDWFRNRKHIQIEISLDRHGYKFGIYRTDNPMKSIYKYDKFTSYQEAREQAIIAAIKHIEENVQI